MAALTADRNIVRRTGQQLNLPVGAGAKIYAGALVAINATGYAVRGATSTTLKGVGVAQEQVDNTSGADGSQLIEVDRGNAYRFVNLAGDALTLADIGATAYIVDDQTVAKTNGGGTRSAAGKVIDVDPQGVWLAFL